MSIKVSFNGATIIKPGTYSKTSVNVLGGFPLSDLGIVGIVGEAASGPPGDDATDGGIATYNVTQISDLVQTYVSGPIVDAARALISPARDNRVPNGAQTVRIWKTNSSVAATSYLNNVDTGVDTYYNLTAKNWGTSGNLLSFYVTAGSSSDDLATVVSDAAIVFPLTVANGDTLAVTINGSTYTLTVATAPGGSVAVTQSQLISLINGNAVTVGADTATPTWAALRPVVASASGLTKIALTLNPATITAATNQCEYALMTTGASAFATSIGFTTASSVNASTLVVTPGAQGPVRGSRGSRIVVINRNAEVETIDENPNDVYLSIYYTGAGTPATMSVLKVGGVKYLQTACTGAASDNLNLKLSDYTIQELVDYINNLSTYTCVTSYRNASVQSAETLDWYNAINIRTLPLNMKGAQLEIENNINNQSQMVSAALVDEVYGAVETISSTAKRYFTGGLLGASTNADFQAGFDALLSTRVNTVVPLVSRDATSDLAEGLTDPSSTYTVSSVIAMTDAHCRTASNTKNRSERNAYVGYKGTFANSVIRAKALNSEFTTLCMQDVDVLDITGELVTAQPHIMACLMAGMQSGMAVGEPITFKYANVYGISHADYDAKADIDTALDAGICVIEQPDSGGYRVVLGNTTYGKDANFCFNRISVLAVAHYVAYNLRSQLEAIFIGTGRERQSTAQQSVYNTASAILASFRDAGLLVPDQSNAYRGYKNLFVSVVDNTINLDVTITPVQGIDFILATITLDNIRDTI